MDLEDVIVRKEGTRLRAFGRAVNMICFFVLLLVMGTVVYGLLLRARWEHSYFIAVAIAIFGVITLLVGLAQQEIAARDKATWRAMAAWQLRATYKKLSLQWNEAAKTGTPVPTVDSDDYYEQIMEALIEDMQRTTQGTTRP